MNDIPTELGAELNTYLITDAIKWRVTLKRELDNGHLSEFAKNFVRSALLNKKQLDEALSKKMGAIDTCLKELDDLEQELKLMGGDVDYAKTLKAQATESKRNLNVAHELAENLNLVNLEMDQMIKDFMANEK